MKNYTMNGPSDTLLGGLLLPQDNNTNTDLCDYNLITWWTMVDYGGIKPQS